jgi:hypothetical protein
MTDQSESADAGNSADLPTGAAALLAGVQENTGETTAAISSSLDTLVSDADQAEWLKTLPDDETRALAKTKGWAAPGDVLKSYTALEKLLGGDKVVLPKGDDDKDGLDRIYKALGRPDAPDGYKLPVPEGQDGAFAGEAAKWFHDAGLSPKQATALAANWNGFAAQAQQAAAKAFDVKGAQDMGDLKTEWGDKFESNMEMARRATAQFGLSPAELGGMERAFGTKRFMTVLSKIGVGLAEDTFEGGAGRGNTFKTTPEAARARIEALKGDAAWQERWRKGGADEKAEWNRLHAAANPGA